MPMSVPMLNQFCWGAARRGLGSGLRVCRDCASRPASLCNHVKSEVGVWGSGFGVRGSGPMLPNQSCPDT